MGRGRHRPIFQAGLAGLLEIGREPAFGQPRRQLDAEAQARGVRDRHRPAHQPVVEGPEIEAAGRLPGPGLERRAQLQDLERPDVVRGLHRRLGQVLGDLLASDLRVEEHPRGELRGGLFRGEAPGVELGVDPRPVDPEEEVPPGAQLPRGLAGVVALLEHEDLRILPPAFGEEPVFEARGGALEGLLVGCRVGPVLEQEDHVVAREGLVDRERRDADAAVGGQPLGAAAVGGHRQLVAEVGGEGVLARRQEARRLDHLERPRRHGDQLPPDDERARPRHLPPVGLEHRLAGRRVIPAQPGEDLAPVPGAGLDPARQPVHAHLDPGGVAAGDPRELARRGVEAGPVVEHLPVAGGAGGSGEGGGWRRRWRRRGAACGEQGEQPDRRQEARHGAILAFRRRRTVGTSLE